MSDEEQYQLELENYFRKLSADRWACGWFQDIEFSAWEDLFGIGKGCFEDYELNHLCELSRYASGWCYFEPGQGATFIPILEWLEMYLEWKDSGDD